MELNDGCACHRCAIASANTITFCDLSAANERNLPNLPQMKEICIYFTEYSNAKLK